MTPYAKKFRTQSIFFCVAALFSAAIAGCGGGQQSNDAQSSQQAVSIDKAQVVSAGLPAGMAQPRVGMNLSGLSYWDRSFAMADVGRQAQTRGLNWSYDVASDANGYPQQDFLLIYSSNIIGAGTYKLMFNGHATVSAGGAGTIRNQIYDSTSNITRADVVLSTNATGNIWLAFTNTYRNAASNVGDGLTNIHLWRPGYPTDGSVLFTKEFLAAMTKFNVVRGMEMVSANSNPQTTWSQRTLPSYFGMTGDNGQSWELLLALANATNRDVWLNVLVNADDDYIRKLAQLVKFGSDGNLPYTSAQKKPVYPPLKPGLRVYLEYGNELWNSGSGFYGFGWALALANSHKSDVANPIAFDGAQTDQYIALRRWIAYRSSFISLTFRSVCGDDAMMTTVRPILAGQVGNGNAYLSNGLEWAASYYGQVPPPNPKVRKPSDIWYGGGGAAYYGAATDPTDTSAASMANYFSNLPSPSFTATSITDSIWTHAYGLKYVSYEGGPGPGGSESYTNTTIPDAYNNDPRMKDRMVLAQTIWDQAGGDELMYYVYSSSPPWSFTDELTQQVVSDTSSVKLQAIDAINASSKPAATLGSMVPATIYLKDPNSGTIGSDAAPWALNGTAYLLRPGITNPAPYVLVPIRATKAGTYQISLDVPNITTGSVSLYVNGTSYGAITLTPNAAGTTTASTKVMVSLPVGLSVLRIEAPVGAEDIFVKDVVVANAGSVVSQ